MVPLLFAGSCSQWWGICRPFVSTAIPNFDGPHP